MKMQTLPETIRYLKEKDPENCLTLSALRRLVKSGKVPAVEIGCKYLVDVDKLEAYLFPRELEREPVRPVTIQPVPYKNPLRW